MAHVFAGILLFYALLFTIVQRDLVRRRTQFLYRRRLREENIALDASLNPFKASMPDAHP